MAWNGFQLLFILNTPKKKLNKKREERDDWFFIIRPTPAEKLQPNETLQIKELVDIKHSI
jgi:hypothetical protein